MNKLGESHLSVWKRMFGDILDWSEAEVLAWAKKYEDYLKDPDDMIYHADPPYWTVSAFVPEALNRKLSPEQRCRLRNELLFAFPTKLHLASYLDVDWKAYKSKISSVIEHYAI